MSASKGTSGRGQSSDGASGVICSGRPCRGAPPGHAPGLRSAVGPTLRLLGLPDGADAYQIMRQSAAADRQGCWARSADVLPAVLPFLAAHAQRS
ncbi:hypothetical protein MF672_025130 [Actinomadura sp. ATCC 31491]|uniref:Uncharacterized protein n=1 Tax=Actinomadura luzonensis TaxID=2805427 RepID=A0ABT0FYM8_9ACTN|nr:hypothetical protein [Actinomadura luzonensis]MCK2217050.1 hypothetical protein [Actinomadura luzonensis]